MGVSLGCQRLPDETWRQTVERYAKRYGLERECLEVFDRHVKDGTEEGHAAWCALYDWDVLELL